MPEISLFSSRRPLAGSVVGVVDHVIDAKSGTFGVRLDLPNAKRAIPAGMRCQVKFAGLEAAK